MFSVTSGNSLLLLRPGCLPHIVLVSTGVFYGICPVVPSMIFILHGGRALEEFGTFPGKHVVICCPCWVLVCLCTMSCVRELWILYAPVLHITTPWSVLLHDMALRTVALALRSVVICYAAHSDIHAPWSTCSVVTPYVVLLNCVFASVWLLTRYEQLI